VIERGPLDASPSPAPTGSTTAAPVVTVGPTVATSPGYPTTERLWEFFKPHNR
jgi:hypothetical protein